MKRTIRKIIIPCDKVNATLFDAHLIPSESPERRINVSRGRKERIYIGIGLKYGGDVLKDSPLTNLDKKVMYVLYSAYHDIWGDDYNTGFISLNDLNPYMGYDNKKPSQNQLQERLQSIYKLMHTLLTMNNKEEINAKYKYPLYDTTPEPPPEEDEEKPKEDEEEPDPGLPLVSGTLTYTYTLYADGRTRIRSADFKLGDVPPLIDFSKGRKQAPWFIASHLKPQGMNDTEMNLSTIYRLLYLRRLNRKGVILTWENLYEHYDATTRKAKLDVRKRVKQILGHWQTVGRISEYKIQSDKFSFR